MFFVSSFEKFLMIGVTGYEFARPVVVVLFKNEIKTKLRLNVYKSENFVSLSADLNKVHVTEKLCTFVCLLTTMIRGCDN